MKKITVALSFAFLTSSALMASDGATLAAKCFACHGTGFEKAPLGRKNHVAKGQRVNELIKKIKYYKNPEEQDEMVMQKQVKDLSDADIKALAEFIAKQ